MDATIINIRFSLSHIAQNQFSTFEIDGVAEKEISEEIGVGFGADEKRKKIGCNFLYQLEADEKPFIKIEVACVFDIEAEDWNALNKDDKIMLPVGFARHLAVITSGTTRGVLFANTRDTAFNNYPMSLVNVEKIVKEDIVLEVHTE